MYSVPSAQSDLPPLQQTGWGPQGWGAQEPPSAGPERDDRAASDRTPGTVYPSSGAPANPAPPAHQQPPAIPPPGADEAQVISDAGPSPAAESYEKWARNQRGAAGTVYGGQRVTSVATASADGGSPLENSGSLTGHILSQGTQDADEADEEEPVKSSNLKVMIIIAIIVVVLVVGGYLAVTFSRSFMEDMFSGVPQK